MCQDGYKTLIREVCYKCVRNDDGSKLHSTFNELSHNMSNYTTTGEIITSSLPIAIEKSRLLI